MLLALGCAFFWGSAARLHAQEFRFERFTVNEGLASSKVFDIAQDSRGLIWIGTELGLCRYNGSAFKTYSVLDGLPGNSVIELYPGQDGRIWLLLQAGLGYWKDGRFTLVRLPESAADERLTSFAANHAGEIYLSSTNSIWKLEGNALVRMVVQEANGAAAQSASQPAERATSATNKPESGAVLHRVEVDHTIWFGTGRMLFRSKEGKTEKLLQNELFAKRQYLDRDPQGRLFYVSTDKVLELKESGAVPVYPALTRMLQSSIDLSTVFIDPEGNWWLGSFNGGLYFFGADQLELGEPVRYLEEESVTEIFQDRDDNLWIGTDAAGLFLLSYRARQVRNVRGDAAGRLTELFDRALQTPDGVSWRLSRSRQANFLVARHPDGDSLRLNSLGNPYKLIRGPGNSVFATTSAGFYQVDWTGALALRTKTSERQEPLPADGFRLLAGPTRVAWYDSLLNRAWLYTMDGLFSYQNRRFDTLVANTELQKLIISGMAGLPGKNQVWMSSYGMGLYFWDTDSLYRFGTEHGLNSNSLVDVWLGQSGEVWVIGSNGVNKLSNIDYSKRIFDIYSLYENDGLIIGEVRGGLELRDTIWLRTNAGLSFFPSDLITREPRTNPGLEITALIINNRDTLLLPAYDLAYFQNDIEVRFSAIAYSDSRRIRYRYRVLGLDEQWQETEFGELRLSKLPPGTYTVELRSVDIYGMESTTTERIRLNIRPAIWQQRGYQVLAGLLVLGLSIGLVWAETRRRARHREAQLILEKQLAETEQKALRAQMNPHFIYNVLNSIQQFILRNDTETALDYLGEFGDLIRRSFENSKHMTIPLRDEIAFLNTYLMLEKMRFDELLEYQIDVGAGVDIEHTFVPSLLIQPFVENSIRHGLRHKEGVGHIDIRFALSGQNLVCTIDDDGVGIDQAMESEQWKPEEHRSSGMEITRSRLQVFNKVNPGQVGMEVFDRKKQGGSGTRVVLTIPMLTDSQKRVTDGEGNDDTIRDRRRRAEGPGVSS